MGLRMDNLHTPTVASGPTTGASADNAAVDKLPLMELIAQKSRVEDELTALGSVLDSVRQHRRLQVRMLILLFLARREYEYQLDDL